MQAFFCQGCRSARLIALLVGKHRGVGIALHTDEVRHLARIVANLPGYRAGSAGHVVTVDALDRALRA